MMCHRRGRQRREASVRFSAAAKHHSATDSHANDRAYGCAIAAPTQVAVSLGQLANGAEWSHAPSVKKVSLRELPHEGVSHDPQIQKQVMIRRGQLPHVTTFARATLTPGQCAHEHEHGNMFEVFFVEAGAGVLSLAGTEHRLEPGLCLVVEPNERHEIRNDGTADLVLNYFGIEA